MNTLSQWRFRLLLAAAVILNFSRVATIGHANDRFIVDLLGVVFLSAATISLCAEQRLRHLALLLGLPSIVLSFIGNLLSSNEEHLILVAGRAASALFFGFAIVIILRTLITEPVVTADSIAGAFCGYVLIGVIFAEAYSILETLVPHSFQAATTEIGWSESPLRRWMTLEYFSFTTLTTLGFGDIVPISPFARSMAVWEAIGGQFYLAVLVAGLVNLRASRTTTESHEQSGSSGRN